MDHRNEGCGCFYPAFVLFGVLYLLISGAKNCSCSSHHAETSPKENYHDRHVREMHERQLEQDRRNGNCENCHGKGVTYFSPNSWGGPGYCDYCKKDVKGEHPHKCSACKGTGKSK